MASEADCGLSTVLEMLRVTSSAGYLAPRRMTSRSSSLWCRRLACMCGRDGRTTRHAGFVCPLWCRRRAYRADGRKFRIPNSEFRIQPVYNQATVRRGF